MTLRDIIRREVARQGISGYRLGKLSGLPIRTVQAYLAGSTDLIGERIEKMLAALALELRPRPRKRKKG